MPIDWTLYESDVVACYVKQDKTAEETIALLEKNHGLRVTIKQFKTKFGGYKNVKADEWAVISSQVKKRALEGKESDVYFNGRLLDAKRVKRELIRYDKKDTAQDGSQSSDAYGWELSRVRVRTPEATSARMDSADECLAHDLLHQGSGGGIINDPTDLRVAHLSHQHLLIQQPQGFIPRMGQGLVHYYTGVVPVQSSSRYSENGLVVNNLTLNLPWTQFQLLLSHSGYFPQASKHVTSLITSITPLSGTLSSRATRRLESLLDKSNVSDTRNIHALFLATAYLVSNNLLDCIPLAQLLKTLDHHKRMDALMSFLDINVPTVRAVCTSGPLLDAALNVGLVELARFLYSKGAKSQRRDIENIQADRLTPPTLKLLSLIYPGILEGDSGGSLLYRLATTQYYDSVTLLLEHGANIEWHGDWFGTPLLWAIQAGTFGMVTRLVEAGANVNAKTNAGHSAVTVAVRRSYSHMIEFLVYHRATVPFTINGLDFFESVEKIEAGLSDKIRFMLVMLDAEEAVSFTSKDIINASQDGSLALAQFIQDHNVKSYYLEMALCEATARRNITAFRRLLQYGVDPNASSYRGKGAGGAHAGFYPLKLALQRRPSDDTWHCARDYSFEAQPSSFIYLLVKHGADVNASSVIYEDIGFSDDLLCTIHMLVQEGLDLVKHGPTILERLVMFDDIASIDYLLSKGVPIYMNRAVQTHLFDFRGYWNTTVLEYLLDIGAGADDTSGFMGTLTATLEYAVSEDDLDTVRLLLKYGSNDCITLSEYGSALLKVASEMHHPPKYMGERTDEIFTLLVKQEATVARLQAGHGVSCMEHLFCAERADLIHLMLTASFPIDSMDDVPGGRTLLQAASLYGNLEFVELALHRGANVNAAAHPINGLTALQAATVASVDGKLRMQIIQTLLDHGADVQAPAAATRGTTALQGAAISGQLDTAQLLIRLGADVNEPRAEINGVTALEGAAKFGRLDMVQFLLNAGAKTDGLSRVVQIAETKGFVEIGRLLRDHALQLGIHLEE